MQKQILGQKAARYASFFFPTIFLLASIGQHTSIISERNPSVTYLQREHWLFNRICLRKIDRRKQRLFSLFLGRLKNKFTHFPFLMASFIRKSHRVKNRGSQDIEYNDGKPRADNINLIAVFNGKDIPRASFLLRP